VQKATSTVAAGSGLNEAVTQQAFLMIESLNRRTLLKDAAAAAASALIASHAAPTQTASAGQFTGRIKKALKFHMITGSAPVAEKLRMVKELGYEGVEIHRRNTLEGENLIDRGELLKASQEVGIPFHGVLNSSSPDLKGPIELAKDLGATSVLVVAGRVNEAMSYDENYRVTQSLLRSAAPLAEKNGIRLLVENVWNNFLLSPLEMARFLDEIGSPAVGAYFDIGNVVYVGWPEQWIKILGSRIGKLDIKEYSRERQMNEGQRLGFDVPLGEGSIDWPAVRQALAEINYQGWATAEVPGGDRERLKDIAQRMDRVLDLA
jgi:L-ribulose-5-phosphate 3-epimerase